MCTHLNCGTNDGVVAQPPATWLKTPAQEGGVSKTPLALLKYNTSQWIVAHP
jgi:hypothetical protein